jgi:serine/threonine protein kinase
MLPGDVPFDGETDFSVQYQQIKTPAPDPRQKNSEISEEMAQIVLKALAKNPAERFQDCGEFLQAIDGLEKHQIAPRSKAVIGVLLAMIVASAGTIVYLYTRPLDISNVATGITDGELLEAKRKAAYNLIQSGSEKAWFACTQFKQLKSKEQGLQLAKRIRDTNLEERFTKQIVDHRMNIDNALTEYSGFLDQLAKVEDPIVVQEFDEYSNFLEKKNSFQQIQIARLMKRHYERHLGGNKSVNLGMMDADCDAVLGKGT